INSSDWDISTTGDLTNIGGITADSDLTVTLAVTEDVDFSIDPGADQALNGLQIDLDYTGSTPLSIGSFLSGDSWSPLMRIFTNHFAENGEKGIELDGWFGAGVMGNNIVNNGEQSTDSGANLIENIWNEEAFAAAYNQRSCLVGNTCQSNNDCSKISFGSSESTCVNNVCQCALGLTPQPDGTCGCYEKAYSVGLYNEYPYVTFPLAYTPLGNYWGTTAVTKVPPSDAPPLTSCTQDDQCVYHTCYSPENQCGNFDTIGHPFPFDGVYDPTTPNCPGFPYSPHTPNFYDPGDPPVEPPIIPDVGGIGPKPGPTE
ncbi:MAG: EB domain-containing protein, partial [archaeon]